MKLHSDALKPDARRITAYGTGFVSVDDERIGGSLVLAPQRLVRDWGPATVEELEASAAEAIEGLAAEIVLVGTGATQRFTSVELIAEFTGRGIGVEVMSTPAACRTYNILVAEGRRVAALLLAID